MGTSRYALQRQSLRLRLQTNRLILAQSTSQKFPVDSNQFPRSHTMRFLSSTPGIVTFLAAEIGPLLLSRYLAKRNRRNNRR